MKHKIQRNTFLTQSNEGVWILTYIDSEYGLNDQLPTGETASSLVREWAVRARRTTGEKKAAAEYLQIDVADFLESSYRQRHLRLDKQSRTMLTEISKHDKKEEPEELRYLIKERYKQLFG